MTIQSRPDVTQKISAGTVTVLYVEDDPVTSKFVTRLLTAYGYRCLVAGNGRKGLELYRQHIPDVVLTDIKMPFMTGLEMAREIRTDYPEAQFIVMTAFGEIDYLLDAIDIGVSQFVVKPVDIKKLLAAVGRCVHIVQLKTEAEKVKHLEALSILAGGIAHDFNNQLQVIMGHIYLARMEAEPGSDAHALLVAAEKELGHAGELGRQLLTYSTGGAGGVQTGHLASLITSAVDDALDATTIAAELELAADLPPVTFDEEQMWQVFSNLAVNAVEAMPSGGTLRIVARVRTLSQEDGVLLPPGDYVHITFQDTGRGIPPENLPRIFDPYFTTKTLSSQKGTGLGLAVCYSVVRKHGGMIIADSAPGAGAAFQVWLPVAGREEA
jgi:signal transduction histidine kinase